MVPRKMGRRVLVGTVVGLEGDRRALGYSGISVILLAFLHSMHLCEGGNSFSIQDSSVRVMFPPAYRSRAPITMAMADFGGSCLGTCKNFPG